MRQNNTKCGDEVTEEIQRSNTKDTLQLPYRTCYRLKQELHLSLPVSVISVSVRVLVSDSNYTYPYFCPYFSIEGVVLRTRMGRGILIFV